MQERIDDTRPSHEALLAEANREVRSRGGHLKIFLGMAPGVGKTFTMLEAARTRAMAGEHVVVGLVETHGRTETAELLLGLSIVPRRQFPYGGTSLDEMDLDEVLRRRPSLVLVDELAHTNAPGSRHVRRFLDVEELLANGIDVYTTVNIQHLESLNDAVAQVTGVRVRETVPDRILERADEIELVDLPVEELLERLSEGKVYVPSHAERAIRKYFREGNLSALRQLALRFVAERVDRQMRTYMSAHAISGPWPTSERLLVSVGPSPLSARLIRATRRMAERRHAEWIAVYVEKPRDAQLPVADRQRVVATLRLAEELGARTATIFGTDVAGELIRFAQRQNVTEIVVGRTGRSRWAELLLGSVVSRLLRNEAEIDVYVVTGDDQEPPSRAATSQHDPRRFSWHHLASPILVVVAAATLGIAIRDVLSLATLPLIFLLGVILTAVQLGLRASIIASFASVLAYNFFFVPPLHTFDVDSGNDVVSLLVYLVVAVLTSNLAGRVRDQANAVRARQERTSALYELSQRIAGEIDLNAIADAIASDIGRNLDGRVVMLVGSEERPEQRASFPPGVELSTGERAAATWSMMHNRVAGRGTETLSGDHWTYVPLSVGRRTLGVVAIDLDPPTRTLDPEQAQFLTAYADLAAIAVERLRMTAEVEAATILSERERLQGLLLSSISHDLRTPLASIVGSASSLLELGDVYPPEVTRDLLLTIREEGERLNRFVGNLLDSTRIEGGTLDLNRDWVETGDVIGSAVRSLAHRLSRHTLVVDIAPGLPLLYADFVLLEHVLLNLLDNADKYSAGGSTIAVGAWREAKEICISVRDEGLGIPIKDLPHIFDKFYRAHHGDQRPAGTGLGLSICRGIILEHGGTVTAESPTESGVGTRMLVRLPIPVEAPTIDQ